MEYAPGISGVVIPSVEWCPSIFLNGILDDPCIFYIYKQTEDKCLCYGDWVHIWSNYDLGMLYFVFVSLFVDI